MSSKRILIVDDNPENLDLLAALIERGGWDYEASESGSEALAKMEKGHFDLVITDLMMPGMSGLELLSKVKKISSSDVILMTAYGSIPTAIEAIKMGAYDYILRPFEPDDVAFTIEKIFELQKIRSENVLLKEELQKVRRYDKIVGKSKVMTDLYKLIDNVAQTNATCLVLGESGSGKELVARALHNKSPRHAGPFVKVSCAALPEHLLESELFGHEKGAFTGAIAMRKGRFELADKGTLFLDEIGEISPSVQVKLLRAVQEREFERVGGTQTIKSDVRLITATNRDLAEEVKNGTFREDLYYRLNVITVVAPPLRDRKEDIPLLAYYFLSHYCKESGKGEMRISDNALRFLTEHLWPGNVRELQNMIERAVVLSSGDTINDTDLPESARQIDVDDCSVEGSGWQREIVPLKEARHSWEKKYVERALSMNDGNISRTASVIGIARKNLQEKIKSYDIDVAQFTGQSKKQ